MALVVASYRHLPPILGVVGAQGIAGPPT